jgi:hypothetical protein
MWTVLRHRDIVFSAAAFSIPVLYFRSSLLITYSAELLWNQSGWTTSVLHVTILHTAEQNPQQLLNTIT